MSQSYPQTVLKADALTCIRDINVLFENLDFSVKSGEVLVIEGTNGSGKTSLLRILTGMREQDDGVVNWNGKDTRQLGATYRENMAYLGHQNGIKDGLTAAENLQMTRIFGKLSDSTIENALDTVGLLDKADLKSISLSAGQKRRLAMARLLVTDCCLWILDEPLTALDRAGIALFERLLQQHLASGGMAILSSHHDIKLDGSHVTRMSL